MKHKKRAKRYIASSNWDGNYYADNSEWQFHVASVALEYLQIPPTAKILDIGCGDGRFTKHLAERLPKSEILGLDPSPSMLATAQAKESPNLSFILGDAMKLPFKNRFDRIVAFNSLHWVSETKVALKQIQKALSPGGKVLILVAPIQVRHPLHRIIDEVAKRKPWRSYFGNTPSVFSFHTLAKWATMLEKAKLIPEQLCLIDASMDYPNKKAFSDSLISWIPFGNIPESKKKEYIETVVEAYLEAIPCGKKGIVHYRLDELVIVASKELAR